MRAELVEGALAMAVSNRKPKGRVTRRRFKTATTKKDAKGQPPGRHRAWPKTVVNRNPFSADGPDQLWVADITQVRTWAGWLYLAVVLDAWSRRIVGWAMAPHMRAELVERGLEAGRRGIPGSDGRDQALAEVPRPPDPGPRRRDRRTRPLHRSARRGTRTRSAQARRRGNRQCGRAPGHRGRESRAAALRSELRDAVRCLPTARLERVVHHSDRGSQYTSLAFGKRCREAGIVQSMGSVGDAYDNAMCESFFATLECELLDRSRFPTPADARRQVFGFIEGFYNTRRIHSALGYKSPANFERLNHAA